MKPATSSDLGAFFHALMSMPRGYSKGRCGGRPWGATLEEAAGGRRYKLFAEELGGKDFVSFNLYLTGDNELMLRPCEMPAEKVIDFVLGYEVQV